MSPADALFDALLAERRLIRYIDAYEALLGRRPRPWGRNVHSREVTDMALQTAPRAFEGLTLRLDALIVSGQAREPGAGHYADKPYSRAQWRQVFGGWPLRPPGAAG